MNFLSIDFGNYTGLAYFRDFEINEVCSFKILSDQSLFPIIVVDKLFEIIKDNNFEIDFFVVEDYSYGKGFFNTNQSEIIGAFKYKVFNEHKKSIYFINSTSIRKILIGNGKATKSEIKKYVKNVYRELKNQHEYDAVFTGLGFKKMQKNLSEATIRRSIIF